MMVLQTHLKLRVTAEKKSPPKMREMGQKWGK